LQTDRLRKLLEARSLSVPRAARATKHSEPTLYRILRGRSAKDQSLARLATFFQVSADYLLGLSDVESRPDRDLSPDPDLAALMNEYSVIRGLPDDVRDAYLAFKRLAMDLALRALR
ncbi:MAG: helix-turn-helix domain-containing protein, partial [Actinomycetota bacterium]